MKKKLLSTLIAAVFMQGCLEIDQDEQNELLAQQNELLIQANQPGDIQQASNPIVLSGVVLDSQTDLPVTSGTVKIKLGQTWSEPVALATGTFELKNIPYYSDYNLLIESTDGSFMPIMRAGRTSFGEAGTTVYTDLGQIKVGAPVEYELTVLNKTTGEAISGLEFSASSSNSNDLEARELMHKSTQDATTGKYKITVPSGLIESVYTSLDVDGDNQEDYRLLDIENNFNSSMGQLSFWFDRNGQEMDAKVELLEAEELPEPMSSTVDVRFTVLDREANAIANLDVETNRGDIATYDAETGQYSVTLELKDFHSTLILIPSFEKGDVGYQSTTINARLSSEHLVVSFSNTNNNVYGAEYDLETTSIDVAVLPRTYTIGKDSVSIIAKQQSIVGPDYDYNVFYASGIELQEDSVTLVQQDTLVKVKGDASGSDFVPAGTTRFTFEDVEVASTATLSLNDTLLSVQPDSELKLLGDYLYRFGNIKIKGTDTTFVNSSANMQFDVVSTSEETFDISDIVVDNNNFSTSGQFMLTENTANDPIMTSAFENRISVVFPSSITSLKNFTLQFVGGIENGSAFTENDSMTVVLNGNVSVGKSYVSATAFNEVISGGITSVERGMTVPDGRYYMSEGFWRWMGDHTGTNENTVKFDYSYELKDGTVSEGSITLQVK